MTFNARSVAALLLALLCGFLAYVGVAYLVPAGVGAFSYLWTIVFSLCAALFGLRAWRGR